MKFILGEDLRGTLIIKLIVNTNTSSGSFGRKKNQKSRIATYKWVSYMNFFCKVKRIDDVFVF